MVSKFYSILLGVVILSSCKNSEFRTTNSKDSTDLLVLALNEREFVKDQITPKDSDTIYILKPKNYSQTWPNKTSYFSLIYIEDNKEARMINKGKGFPYDKRIRISPLYKQLKNDTLAIMLIDHGGYMDYIFKALKTDGKWRIVFSNKNLY